MTKIDPESVELMRHTLQQTFGRYTVAFTKTMSGANGGSHYDVVIQDVEKHFDPLLIEFSTGSAWKIPPATHALDCTFSDYLDATERDPDEFEPDVWERLQAQARKVERCGLSHYLSEMSCLVYELGIGLEIVAPFLIDKATLDGDEIPVRGEFSL